MGAREKLNGVYLTGCLLVAGVAGLATGSLTVFIVVLAALVAIGLVDGNIRPRNRRN